MSRTAEWRCTRCGATNRRIVPDEVDRTTDRCVTCHTRHTIERDARPAFWKATAAA